MSLDNKIYRGQIFTKVSYSGIVIGILIILYLVGLLGVTLPLHKDFMLLTPINLLCTFLLALSTQKSLNAALIWALVLCYTIGFSVELLGVQSGVLFGEYSYGATLGPKIAGTPLLIGLNWAMLIYGVASIGNHWTGGGNILLKSMLGATLMLFLDIWIEPAALRYDFWHWVEPPVNSLIVAPFQNYVMWWICAFGLNMLFHCIVPNVKNRVIELLFGLQLFFFAWIFFFVK